MSKTGWMVFLLSCSMGAVASSPLAARQLRADSLYNERNWKDAAREYLTIFEERVKHAGNVVDPAPDQGLSEELGKIAFRAGRAFTNAGELEPAAEWYRKASSLFKQLPLNDNYYVAQGQLGSVLDDLGDYQAAIDIVTPVVAYFKQTKDSTYAAPNMHNLAMLHYHNGAISRSIGLLTEAIAWAGPGNTAQQAMSYNQLGNIWADDLKDERKALAYYRQSLQLKLNKAAPQSIAAAYNNIGLSFKNLGMSDSAFFNYSRALHYARQSAIPRSLADPLLNIANLQKANGNQQAARQAYDELLTLKEYLPADQLLTVLVYQGTVANTEKRFQQALHYLRQAEGLLARAGGLNDKADVKAQLAIAYSGLNDPLRAVEAEREYARWKDSVYSREREQSLAGLMVRYQSAEKDKALLAQQQELQLHRLESQRRILWLIVGVSLVVLLAAFLFFLYKRNEAKARQALQELQLKEQKELNRLQEERLRISRELHDNIGSYLTLMSAHLEQLRDDNCAESVARYEGMQHSLTMSMRELRKTVWLLNKQRVSIDEIAIRLRDFFKPIHQNGMHIRFVTSGDTTITLTEIQTTHLFRIIQEAIINAYKHARCTQVEVKLEVDGERDVLLLVHDNGKGFDANAGSGGNGLRNMQSRMKELGGELILHSVRGNGTRISGKIRTSAYGEGG
mgnify:CR=1 FL=1